MAHALAGSDGSFYSGWQLYQRIVHGSATFVLSYDDVSVYRLRDDGEWHQVTFVRVDESDLPDGVVVDGWYVHDHRDG
ncbi:MAG: hypothetical protein ABEJ70_09190 [Halobacteriaceae archaeon]